MLSDDPLLCNQSSLPPVLSSSAKDCVDMAAATTIGPMQMQDIFQTTLIPGFSCDGYVTICDQPGICGMEESLEKMSLVEFNSTNMSMVTSSKQSKSVKIDEHNGTVDISIASHVEQTMQDKLCVLSNLQCDNVHLLCTDNFTRYTGSSSDCGITCLSVSKISSVMVDSSMQSQSEIQPVADLSVNSVLNNVGNSNCLLSVDAELMCNGTVAVQLQQPNISDTKQFATERFSVCESLEKKVIKPVLKKMSGIAKSKKQVTIESPLMPSGESYRLGSALKVPQDDVSEKKPNSFVKSLEVTHVESIKRYHESDETDSDEENSGKLKRDRIRDEEESNEKPVCSSPNGRFLKFDIEIGRGSFKTVYKGLDSETGVQVAWCELPERMWHKSGRQRFVEEADMLKTLQHPNIVRFYDFFEDLPSQGTRVTVLVTELMTSGTLKTYVKRFKKINMKVLKNWCRQILKGLSFLHSRTPPVIHRDLKCDNIFITGTTGCVKIGDLGLATLRSRSYAKSVIGTPEFMAPEMYDECYKESVDVYAFGMCMIEMATSEYPYSECRTAAQIYKKVSSGTRPAAYSKIQDSELKEIIEKCTRSEPEERYTVKELLQHDFFLEETGIKVDLAEHQEPDGDRIRMWLRVVDPKKHKPSHKPNEAIEFEYNLGSDDPETLAKEMVRNSLATSNDIRTIVRQIKAHVQQVSKERCRREGEISNAGAGALPLQTDNGQLGAANHPQCIPNASHGVNPTALQSNSVLPVKNTQSVTPRKPILNGLSDKSEPKGTKPVTQMQKIHSVTAASPAVALQNGSILKSPSESESDLECGASGATVSCGVTPSEKQKRRDRCRRKKSELLLPRLTFINVDPEGELVECQLETTQQSMVSFKFSRVLDQPTEIAQNLVDREFLTTTHVASFVEQMSAVIQLIQDKPRIALAVAREGHTGSSTLSELNLTRHSQQSGTSESRMADVEKSVALETFGDNELILKGNRHLPTALAQPVVQETGYNAALPINISSDLALTMSSGVARNLHLESLLDGNSQSVTNPYPVPVADVGIVLQKTEQSILTSLHNHSALMPQQHGPAAVDIVPQDLEGASLPRPSIDFLTNHSHLVTSSMQELIFQSHTSGLSSSSCDEIGQQHDLSNLASLQMISRLQQELVPSLWNQNAVPQMVQNVSAVNHQMINQMPEASQSVVQMSQTVLQTLDHVPPHTATQLLPGFAPLPQSLISVPNSVIQTPQLSMQIAHALNKIPLAKAQLSEAAIPQDVVDVPQFIGQLAACQKQMSQTGATVPHNLSQFSHNLTELSQAIAQVSMTHYKLPETVLQMAQTVSQISQTGPEISQTGVAVTQVVAPMPQTLPKMLPAGTRAAQVLTPMLPTVSQMPQIGVVTTQALASMSQTVPQTVTFTTQTIPQIPEEEIEAAQAVAQVPKMVLEMSESLTQVSHPIPFVVKGGTNMPLGLTQVTSAFHETPLSTGTCQQTVGQIQSTDGSNFKPSVAPESQVGSVPVESIVQRLASLSPESLTQYPLVTAFLQKTLSSLSDQILARAPVFMENNSVQQQQQKYSTAQFVSNQLQPELLSSVGLGEEPVLPQTVDEHYFHPKFAQQLVPVSTTPPMFPSMNLNSDPLVSHAAPGEFRFSGKVPVLTSIDQNFVQPQSYVHLVTDNLKEAVQNHCTVAQSVGQGSHSFTQELCHQPAGSLLPSANQTGAGVASISVVNGMTSMENRNLFPGLSLPAEQQRMLMDLKRLLVGFGITPDVAEQAINLYPHMLHMNSLSGSSGLFGSCDPSNPSTESSSHSIPVLAPSESCLVQELSYHFPSEETIREQQNYIQANGLCSLLDLEPSPCSVETYPGLEQGSQLSKAWSNLNVHGKAAEIIGYRSPVGNNSPLPKGVRSTVPNISSVQEAETCHSPFVSGSESIIDTKVGVCDTVTAGVEFAHRSWDNLEAEKLIRGHMFSCVTQKETFSGLSFSGPQMSSLSGFTAASTEHFDQMSREQANERERLVNHAYNYDLQNSFVTRACPVENVVASSVLCSNLPITKSYMDAPGKESSREVNACLSDVANNCMLKVNTYQQKVNVKQDSTELADAEVAFCLGEELPQRTMSLRTITTNSSSIIPSSVKASLEMDIMESHEMQVNGHNFNSQSLQNVTPSEIEMSFSHQNLLGRRDCSFTPSHGYSVASPLSVDEVDGQQTKLTDVKVDEQGQLIKDLFVSGVNGYRTVSKDDPLCAFYNEHPELLEYYKSLIDENLGEILDKVTRKINEDLMGRSSEARFDVKEAAQIVSNRNLEEKTLNGSLSHVQNSPDRPELGLSSTSAVLCQTDIMQRTATESQPNDGFSMPSTSSDQSRNSVMFDPTGSHSISSSEQVMEHLGKLLPAQLELYEALSPATRNAAAIEYWSSIGTQKILSLMRTGSEQQTICNGIRSEVEKLLHECMKHFHQRSCGVDIDQSELGDPSESLVGASGIETKQNSDFCQMKLDQHQFSTMSNVYQSLLPINMSSAQGESLYAWARHSVDARSPLPDVIGRLEEEFVNCRQQGLGVSKSAGNLPAMELASHIKSKMQARHELQSTYADQQPCLLPREEPSESVLQQQPRIVSVDQMQQQFMLPLQQHLANVPCCKVGPCIEVDPLNFSSRCCSSIDAKMLQQQQGIGGQLSAAGGLASALAAEQWRRHQLASLHLAWKEAVDKQQLDRLRQLEIMQLQMEQVSLLSQTGSELHSGPSMSYRTLPEGVMQNSHQVRTVQVINQEDTFNLNGLSCQTESNRGLLISNDIGGLTPLQFPYMQMPSEMQRQQSLPLLRRTSTQPNLQMSPAFGGSMNHVHDLLTSMRYCANEDSSQSMSSWVIGDSSVSGGQVEGYPSTCPLFGHQSQLTNLQNQMFASSGRLFPFVPRVDQVPPSHLINGSCLLAPVNGQMQCTNLTQQQQQLQNHQQCLIQRQLLLQNLHSLPESLPLHCNIVSNPLMSKPNSNVKST